MPNYAQIITLNYPNNSWSLTDNDYATLQWLSDTPKPTQAELDALWESTQATVAAQKQAAIDTKASALAKLAALGLTQDEVKALVG
jgi:hypothetical protein